jgi:hypothetical protein
MRKLPPAPTAMPATTAAIEGFVQRLVHMLSRSLVELELLRNRLQGAVLGHEFLAGHLVPAQILAAGSVDRYK